MKTESVISIVDQIGRALGSTFFVFAFPTIAWAQSPAPVDAYEAAEEEGLGRPDCAVQRVTSNGDAYARATVGGTYDGAVAAAHSVVNRKPAVEDGYATGLGEKPDAAVPASGPCLTDGDFDTSKVAPPPDPIELSPDEPDQHSYAPASGSDDGNSGQGAEWSDDHQNFGGPPALQAAQGD